MKKKEQIAKSLNKRFGSLIRRLGQYEPSVAIKTIHAYCHHGTLLESECLRCQKEGKQFEIDMIKHG